MKTVRQCRNCGATIHEGDTFCRTCAMPVEDNLETENNSRNLATNDFMSSSFDVPQTVVSNEDNPEFSNLFKEDTGNQDNKQYINQDGNDRAKATFFNFLQLFLLVIVVALVLFFVFQLIF